MEGEFCRCGPHRATFPFSDGDPRYGWCGGGRAGHVRLAGAYDSYFAYEEGEGLSSYPFQGATWEVGGLERVVWYRQLFCDCRGGDGQRPCPFRVSKRFGRFLFGWDRPLVRFYAAFVGASSDLILLVSGLADNEFHFVVSIGGDSLTCSVSSAGGLTCSPSGFVRRAN